LETAAKQLKSLERYLANVSKCVLKSLDNQTDFDSATRRFESSPQPHQWVSGGYPKPFGTVALRERRSFQMIVESTGILPLGWRKARPLYMAESGLVLISVLAVKTHCRL
jgi:hypothetical protein